MGDDSLEACRAVRWVVVMPDEAKAYVLGLSRDTTPAESLALGSRIVLCHSCGAQVWVAPTSLRAIAAGEVAPICAACVHRWVHEGGGVELQGFLPGAVADHVRGLMGKRRN
jgi:GH24 family phage-related lysozyme (muramidase)